MEIKIQDVSKVFGTFRAVKNIDLEIQNGNFVALLGPSGSGKTTLLRIIAGLEGLESGTILFNGNDYTLKSVKERKIGFVFQNYALFKHLTVFNNIAFGLKVKPRKVRPSNFEIKEKVNNLLKLVQLEQFAERYPSQLSGGQRQRVALARALAVDPEVLLLDEPFGALDAKVREEMRQWLRQIHQKLNITTIFVTHDQEEALEMSDKVVVMNNGHIEQIGTPEEVYHYPANAFVCRFLGKVNTFRGESLLQYTDSSDKIEKGVGYIRPHDIVLQKRPLDNLVPSEITHILTIGSTVRIILRRIDTDELFETEMLTNQYNELGHINKGDILYADFKKIIFFSNDTTNNAFSV
ncbi:sulfate/molybdate ABC transporter ATP-binding protein [Bacillus sp. JJ1562]|uniref:sulfate/molybdate ABC transporter ATP-binding protein n=1 Tax=Bacillus sp. JJ1562 TaxID=3122960 RepID=UPI0030037B9F